MNNADDIMAMMDAKSLAAMTDDDISAMRSLLGKEKTRRDEGEKKPVFVVSHVIYKDLKKALTELKGDIDDVLTYGKGCESYFDDSIKRGFDTTLLSLKMEFWNEAEYEARPDEMFTS